MLADKVYDKVTRRAEKLVATGEQIGERELGIPIINKRISVTPDRHGRCDLLGKQLCTRWPKALDRSLLATTGVNFVGGFSATGAEGLRQGR